MAIGYKLFKVGNDNKLYPLYIFTDEAMEENVWIKAKAADKIELKKNNKVSYQVKSKIGYLAYRPGLHVTTCPAAHHIGVKIGDMLYQRDDTVWTLVEYSDRVNYQAQALKAGTKPNGKVEPRMCCLDYIPENGYYFYQTNASAQVPWLICGEIKIIKRLTHDEVSEICRKKGVPVQPMASEATELHQLFSTFL